MRGDMQGCGPSQPAFCLGLSPLFPPPMGPDSRTHVACMSRIRHCSWIFPSPGEIAHSYKVQKLSTIGQFVISGMVLQASQVVAALKSPFPILYGVLSILFVTPLLGIAVMALPWIHPFEFKVGMAVFCCVPTTLSSCVALANQCNGNAAVANIGEIQAACSFHSMPKTCQPEIASFAFKKERG